ncbi:DUF6308 family protein [Nocardia nova]|uniref:DUF6308 family protein n=1 Tax=Nocardia nova TaxID=37330 RepID=UPI001C71AAF0|nr:DUF6308 family protein [Nocardia nova]
MNFTLPPALRGDDNSQAVLALHRYFGDPYLQRCYTGAYFDSWPPGCGGDDADRFTAEDLVAVTFLSVTVPPLAARALLVTEADRYSRMLEEVGPDRDLADEAEPPTPSWPAWQLEYAVRALPGLGRTTASKLLARKRPRLLPIWDTVVAAVFGTQDRHLGPVWEALRHNDNQLHHRLTAIRELAGLPQDISVLRVLDVVAWMHGKHNHTDGDNQLNADLTSWRRSENH